MGKGNIKVIGEFVDPDTITFNDGWFHGAGRYGIPVGK
jgi:hypothetical protein